MAWSTPSLKDVRKMVRDFVVGSLPGADASVPNRVLRVMSDAKAALAHLVLQYIDWLSLMLLPLTAAGEWLDRHGKIWITNADGSKGRKAATYATGSATFTGTAGIVIGSGTQIMAGNQVTYETTAPITLGGGATTAAIRALDAGAAGNLDAGTRLSLVVAVSGVDPSATVVSLSGGADAEADEDLRGRILDRIQQPPMGGDTNDYIQWAEQVAGVTRAWAAPNEMGMGTVTLRFMMDVLRATGTPTTNGVPLAGDIATVLAYIDTKRPVAIKDRFVSAPIMEPMNITINNMVPDDSATRAAVLASVAAMLKDKARPNFAINGVLQGPQIIHAAWINEAIQQAAGVQYFDPLTANFVPSTNGSMACLGTITYVP
jgi:uncharacterized phage protein gp47/JayE